MKESREADFFPHLLEVVFIDMCFSPKGEFFYELGSGGENG